MANVRTSKKLENVAASIESNLMDILMPVLQALPKPASDNGHDLPTDGSLKFIIGSVLQLLHEQTYGQLSFRDKRTGAMVAIPNARQRFETSEEQFRKLVAKHSGNDEALVSDPDYDRIAGWFGVNEARFTAYRRLIDCFEAVYTTCAGTPFTWAPRVPTKVETAVLSAAELKAKREAASYLIKRVA
jgi:hypothetical protein